MVSAGNILETKTDAELVELARSGDREAFDELVKRYRPASRRLAYRLLRREELAEEIVQESLVRAWLSLDKLRDPTSFRSWLFGIVLNVGRSSLAEHGGVSLDAVLEGVQPASLVSFDSPEHLAECGEKGRLVLESVLSLTPADRDFLLLFYWAELSVAEIASMRGKSVGTVKVGLHRARQRLKTRLTVLYPELIPAERRRKNMIKVTIADIVPQLYPYAIHIGVLRDEAGKRALPIWIGEREGSAIAMGLREFSLPRPMTIDFFTNILQVSDVHIEEVRIELLRETTFYAVVKVRCGKKVSEVDARPSDALALAVQTGSPIFVTEDVMQNGGVDVPPEAGEPSGRGIDAILDQLKGAQNKPSTKEEIVAAVFGTK